MSDTGATFQARGASLFGRLARPRQARSPAARWAILAAAAALVVGSAWYASHSLADEPLASDWPVWLAGTAALAVVAFAVNAAEFALSARLLDTRAGFGDSLRVSILGSAANLLPVPGAALVRSAALKRTGLGYKAAVSMTVVIGVAWVATSGAVAGALLIAHGATGVGGASLAAGIVGLGISFVLLAGQLTLGGAARGFPLVVAVELASVGTGVVRSWLVLQALGVDTASFADAAVFTAAGVVASAAGLLPGGLGLREALSGTAGVGLGLPLAIGILVATVDRVVAYVVLGACSALVLLLTPGPARRADASSDVAASDHSGPAGRPDRS